MLKRLWFYVPRYYRSVYAVGDASVYERAGWLQWRGRAYLIRRNAVLV